MDAESGGYRELVLHGGANGPMGKGTFGVSCQVKSIVKHRILGLGKRVRSAKKTDGLILMICTSCDMFLCKDVSFRVMMIAPALTF